MENVLKHYQQLAPTLRRYLPKATGITFAPIAVKTCSEATQLGDTLSKMLATDTPQGWLICQSSTIMLDGNHSLSLLLGKQYLLEAELVHQNTNIRVFYESGLWNIGGFTVSQSQQPNALAIHHQYAVDGVRFKAGYQADYWVIWSELKGVSSPIAQCLRGIRKVKEA